MKYQKEALQKFPLQLAFALKNFTPHHLEVSKFNNIVFCGLGGSGIASHIVKAYFSAKCPLPMEVISDYTLPAYVNEKSLVILNSYSGNTEETINNFREAKARKATTIALTTGGELLELSKLNQNTYYLAETGFQPRMALGYSFTYLLLIVAELLKQDISSELSEIVGLLRQNEKHINEASLMFESIGKETRHKFIIICDQYSSAIGLRFAQQVNENAKAEAFINILPETNHNVIETFYDYNHLNSVFIFMDSHQNQRVSLRFDFLYELMKEQKLNLFRYDFADYSLKTIFNTIYYFDWLSLLIADVRQVKSDEIPNINRLKNFLSKKRLNFCIFSILAIKLDDYFCIFVS
jgi:glucose/mannose-6-phosphate isomerase